MKNLFLLTLFFLIYSCASPSKSTTEENHKKTSLKESFKHKPSLAIDIENTSTKTKEGFGCTITITAKRNLKNISVKFNNDIKNNITLRKDEKTNIKTIVKTNETYGKLSIIVFAEYENGLTQGKSKFFNLGYGKPNKKRSGKTITTPNGENLYLIEE